MKLYENCPKKNTYVSQDFIHLDVIWNDPFISILVDVMYILAARKFIKAIQVHLSSI